MDDSTHRKKEFGGSLSILKTFWTSSITLNFECNEIFDAGFPN